MWDNGKKPYKGTRMVPKHNPSREATAFTSPPRKWREQPKEGSSESPKGTALGPRKHPIPEPGAGTDIAASI
jgi:hypothetical protein